MYLCLISKLEIGIVRKPMFEQAKCKKKFVFKKGMDVTNIDFYLFRQKGLGSVYIYRMTMPYHGLHFPR